MLDVTDKSAPELQLDDPSTLTKRELIEQALAEDPSRSDRQIAREIGVDHKTVGAARARISPPLGNGLGNAVGILDAEIAANAVAEALTRSGFKPPAEPEDDVFAPGSEVLVIPHQPAIAVYENTSGAVVIRQAARDSYHDEDQVITVRPQHIERLVARLRQVAESIGE